MSRSAVRVVCAAGLVVGIGVVVAPSAHAAGRASTPSVSPVCPGGTCTVPAGVTQDHSTVDGSQTGDGKVVNSRASGPAPAADGYRLVAGDGGVFNFGNSAFYGSAATDAANCPTDPPARSMPGGSCWSIASTPDNQGYWIVSAYSGRVFPFGDAAAHGQPADSPAYAGSTETWPTAIGIVATSDGKGYWVLLSGLSGLGSVQAFGDAAFYGDEVTLLADSVHPGHPVAMAATSDGKGYWIVDSDGGVFSFGDAVFHGSMGGQHLNAPVVAVAPTATGAGYWLTASDGGVFAFGDAAFGGSMGGVVLNAPVGGIARDPSGTGYWLAAADGGVFALGGAPFLGSMGASHLNRPVFGIASSQALG